MGIYVGSVVTAIIVKAIVRKTGSVRVADM